MEFENSVFLSKIFLKNFKNSIERINEKKSTEIEKI